MLANIGRGPEMRGRHTNAHTRSSLLVLYGTVGAARPHISGRVTGAIGRICFNCRLNFVSVGDLTKMNADAWWQTRYADVSGMLPASRRFPSIL